MSRPPIASNEGQCDSVGTRQTNLLRKGIKCFSLLSAGYRADEGCDSEEGQEYFEYCATGIVLVGRLDITSDNMRSGYFMKKETLLVQEDRKEKQTVGRDARAWTVSRGLW